MNGNNNYIYGNAEYHTGSCKVSGTISGSTTKIDTAYTMPDFTDIIQASGIICSNQAEFNNAVQGKTVDGPIYVNGNITINGRIKGSGIICASGTISITSDQDPTDSICFYAANGNITFNGGSGLIYGILYAPNGKITVNGGPNGYVYGRLIGKSVSVNGSKFSVQSNANDLTGLSTLQTIQLVE